MVVSKLLICCVCGDVLSLLTKSVSLSICLTRCIGDFEVELGQEQGLLSLTAVELLGLHKGLEVFVISNNMDWLV
jgi:hypothetical protein